MLDFILEFLVEIVLEISAHTSVNKKYSLWIRIPCIILLILFFALIIFVTLGLMGVSVTLFMKQKYVMGIMMFLLFIIVQAGIYRYVKQFNKIRK